MGSVVGHDLSKKWLDHMQSAFRTYIGIKSVIYFTLLARYIGLQSRYLSTLAPLAREQLSLELADYGRFIRQYGVVFRHLGAIGMLASSVSLLAELFFKLANKLSFDKLADRYRNDTFVQSHLDPDSSIERFDRLFDGYIQRLSESNMGNQRTIFLKLKAFPKETSRFARELKEEELHLSELAANKSNSRHDSQQAFKGAEQVKFVLRFYALAHVIYTATILLILIAAVKAAHKRCLEKGETPLNFLERLCFFELHISSFFIPDRVLSPLVILVADMRYRSEHLRTIQHRLGRLNGMLIELQFSKRIDLSAKRYYCIKSFCDREALEIYLNMRLFIDEIKTTTAMASMIVSQYCLWSLALLASSLPFYIESTYEQHMILMGVFLDVGLTVNAVFIVCAAFESNCSKTLQSAWSLVANMTANDEHLAAGANKTPECTTMCAKIRPGDYFVLNHMRGTLINAHTALLWRRFVQDIPTLSKNFLFVAFGNIELDYSSIIRMNFWFISVVLIFLTHVTTATNTQE